MVNKVILVGNLGDDPEVRHLENDNMVANFAIATNESYKNKSGEKVTDTEWHFIEVWGGLAKVAEKYLKKGNMVYIEGKIKTDNWEDKEGNKRKTTRIRANNMTMLGSKSDATQTASIVKNEPTKKDIESEILTGDDLPF